MVVEYQKEKKCPDLWHVRNCEIISTGGTSKKFRDYLTSFDVSYLSFKCACHFDCIFDNPPDSTDTGGLYSTPLNVGFYLMVQI